MELLRRYRRIHRTRIPHENYRGLAGHWSIGDRRRAFRPKLLNVSNNAPIRCYTQTLLGGVVASMAPCSRAQLRCRFRLGRLTSLPCYDRIWPSEVASLPIVY